MEFNAEEYWKDREFKKWVVVLGEKRGNGRRDKRYVRARSAQGAVNTAAYHSHLRGKVSGRARLATPQDLGCA